MSGRIEIPERGAAAVRLAAGGRVHVVNTFGGQVIDTWAFAGDDMGEFMSMEHTRASCRKLLPDLGEPFVTNRRRPILTRVEDDTPGIHDTLIAACDPQRYEQLGHLGYHENCTENLRTTLEGLELAAPTTPCPLNLFMNIPVVGSGALEWHPTRAEPGDAVVLRAEMDCLVVFSACPMDIVPINGVGRAPRAAHFFVD